jgi:hypothetical protein
MKKNIMFLLGGVALLCIVAAFLLPIGTGIIRYGSAGAVIDNFRGYDFVFSNTAGDLTRHSYGGPIAAFSLLIIAAVFELFGFFFSIPESAKKFAGFMSILAALCLIAVGVIFLLSKQVIGLADSALITYKLGYGFWGAGAASFLGALLLLGVGFVAFAKGKK